MSKNKDTTTIMSLEDVYSELKKDENSLETKYSFIHPIKTNNKTITLSLGRCWFNLLLPDDFQLINETVNKNKLKTIVNQILKNYEADKAANALTIINRESFKMASICPVTFDIDSCIVPQNIINRRNSEITKDIKPEDFAGRLKSISEDYVNNSLQDSGIGKIIKSGAKNSPTDFGVLTIAKGPTIDIEGHISEPIVSALTEGYTPKEYYTSAAEARRSLYIRAVGTAEPGYLARTVTYANSNTLISEEDCKTKKYLELFVKNSMVGKLIGRYMVNDSGKLEEITIDTNILNKNITLRSPIYCRSKNGICKVCYGKLAEKLNTKHIGLVAASAINSAGIEGYAMRARHQSVQVKLREVDFISDMLQI